MWKLRQENPEFEASLVSDNHCRMRFDKRREPKLKEILHSTSQLYGHTCSVAKLNALNPERATQLQTVAFIQKENGGPNPNVPKTQPQL